jgi:hypothetical protein
MPAGTSNGEALRESTYLAVMQQPDAYGDVSPVGELAVDGPTLTHILGKDF